MLKVEQLKTSYGFSQVLFGVDLELQEGEMVTLMGRNGMGKTTTVNSIMGIIPPQSGTITLENRSIFKSPSYKIAQRGIGLVPEGRMIFPNLTAYENLVATGRNQFEVDDPWTIEKIMDLFPGLAKRLKSMGNLLSGGEQQMLAIGRALMTNPKLLILDEATEGLAPLIRKEIWNCLLKLKKSGQSILVIDKNVKDLTRIADKHFIIEKGKIVWNGTSEELTKDNTILERYLGI
ncbi:MAG: ABC transporter ATP-binding protein [Proteobacteria bacterium]|nr:ABC transporter ATP-binding protein [Pseudomonadota bacterium]